MSENIAPPIVAEFSYMTKADTTTCDACGTRYAFTSVKDRCPVCCPVHEEDESESEQTDWANDDDG
jgi:hypothetical protein